VVRVEEGTLQVRLPVKGFAQPSKETALQAPFDGRVESVFVQAGQWVTEDDPIALLFTHEAIAMMDAEPTTPPEVLEKRWGAMFRPREVKCPFPECYIVELLVKAKQNVQIGQMAAVVTPDLSLVAPFPTDMHVYLGAKHKPEVTLWVAGSPEGKFKAGEVGLRKEARGRALAVEIILPRRSKDISKGTALQGWIAVEKDVLKVPSRTIQKVHGRAYLAVEVEVGLDNGTDIELLTPFREGTAALVPAGAKRSPKPGPGPRENR